MKKETKMKMLTGALVVTMAVSALGMAPVNAYAESGAYKQGTIVQVERENGEIRDAYIMKDGDNLSRVSEKLCRKVYGIEPTTKYWPVLAFMNGYPKVGQPGDEIIYPATLEEMEARLSFLKKSGLFAKYVQQNNIYKKKFTVSDLLHDIYSSQVCVDPDFIANYLETLGLTGIYDADTVIQSTQDLFYLTEWIPSLPQLYPGMDIWSAFDLHYNEDDAWMFSDPEAEYVNTK